MLWEGHKEAVRCLQPPANVTANTKRILSVKFATFTHVLGISLASGHTDNSVSKATGLEMEKGAVAGTCSGLSSFM